MFKLFCVLLVAVLFTAYVRGNGNDDDDFNLRAEAEVIKVMNKYMLALNGLTEYSSGPNCNFAAVNVAGLSAAASTLIDTFISNDIKSFFVQQTTAGVPGPIIVSNLTVGGPADPSVGQPALTNSSVLKAYLKSYYVGFSGFFFSAPFWWMLSAPVVTINHHDTAYGGRTTAHLQANNENKGFFCAGTRGFRIQFSLYQHVFVKENGTWKFIHFGEDNKGMINIDTAVITQVQPVFPPGA